MLSKIKGYLNYNISINYLVSISIPKLFHGHAVSYDDEFFQSIFDTKYFLISEADIQKDESFFYSPKIYNTIIDYVISKKDETEFPEYLKNYKEYLSKFKEPFKYMLEPLFSCVIIKREVIEKIGLMDENYTPAFWEDQDYCLRALYAGYSLATSNLAFVFHTHSTTSSAISKEIFEKNRQYFYKKHPLGKWIWEHKRSNIIRDLKNYIKEGLA